MRQRRVLTLLATAAVIALTAGCATPGADAVASRTESVPPSALAGQLTGTWRGWFVQHGSDGNVTGDMTLVIKDDATYKLISNRWGRGDVAGRPSNESGVVVGNNRSITLKSSSGGRWITLMRKGNTLYGVTSAPSGHTIQIDMEKTSGPEAP
jgi:hypothetical protein